MSKIDNFHEEVNETTWGNLVERMKSFFGFKDPDTHYYTAKQASLLALEHEVELDDEKRVRNFIAKVNSAIEFKCEAYEFNCTYAIPIHIQLYKGTIMDYFRQRGFDVIDLSEKVPEIKQHILYIDWSEKYNTIPKNNDLKISV